MKLESLRYFHVMQECGSIRKAADRLHIAPSAISRQIAILERELKLRLLERTSSGVVTTAAGRLLAQHMQSIFRDIGRAQAAIDDLKGLQVGEVTIYAMEGLVSNFLPSLITRFNAVHPGISFNLVLAATDRIIEARPSINAVSSLHVCAAKQVVLLPWGAPLQGSPKPVC